MRVLESNPSDFETLRVLGVVMHESDEEGKIGLKSLGGENARKFLQRAYSSCPAKIDLLIDMAVAFENTKPAHAHVSYLKALELLDLLNHPVPREVWNNVGMLSYQLGKLEDSLTFYKKALGGDENLEAHNESNVTSATVTILFNLAVLYEAMAKESKVVIFFQCTSFRSPKSLNHPLSGRSYLRQHLSKIPILHLL